MNLEPMRPKKLRLNKETLVRLDKEGAEVYPFTSILSCNVLLCSKSCPP